MTYDPYVHQFVEIGIKLRKICNSGRWNQVQWAWNLHRLMKPAEAKEAAAKFAQGIDRSMPTALSMGLQASKVDEHYMRVIERVTESLAAFIRFEEPMSLDAQEAVVEINNLPVELIRPLALHAASPDLVTDITDAVLTTNAVRNAAMRRRLAARQKQSAPSAARRIVDSVQAEPLPDIKVEPRTNIFCPGTAYVDGATGKIHVLN